jgi:hypothetical protein
MPLKQRDKERAAAGEVTRALAERVPASGGPQQPSDKRERANTKTP